MLKRHYNSVTMFYSQMPEEEDYSDLDDMDLDDVPVENAHSEL